jgi:hypothetical protein
MLTFTFTMNYRDLAVLYLRYFLLCTQEVLQGKNLEPLCDSSHLFYSWGFTVLSCTFANTHIAIWYSFPNL